MWIWCIDVFEMVIVGGLIYWWYPIQVRNNTYAVKCPTVQTGTTLWNQSNCLSANPISQWTNVSYMVVITYLVAWLLWLANMIGGNN